MLEQFSFWMKNNTNLAASSIYKYTHSLKIVSDEMYRKKVIPKELIVMSAYEADIFLPVIFSDNYFISKDSRGRRMYSNALKHFRAFLTENNELNDNKAKAEELIENYNSISETERLSIINSRIGQGIFKEKLLIKYNYSCIITGITTKELLLASHIKPWAVSKNEERLSSENGLLLSPAYDKLFDRGLISFCDNGKILISSHIDKKDLATLKLEKNDIYDLKVTLELKRNLEYHRDMLFIR